MCAWRRSEAKPALPWDGRPVRGVWRRRRCRSRARSRRGAEGAESVDAGAPALVVGPGDEAERDHGRDGDERRAQDPAPEVAGLLRVFGGLDRGLRLRHRQSALLRLPAGVPNTARTHSTGSTTAASARVTLVGPAVRHHEQATNAGGAGHRYCLAASGDGWPTATVETIGKERARWITRPSTSIW
jgi:hypothetical protein